jgi:hypothetical protein
MRTFSFLNMRNFLAATTVALSLVAVDASAVSLTGTWTGVQICPGVGENGPFVQQTEEGSELHILDNGDTTLKAYSNFFEQSYTGLFINTETCSGKTFSLVDCSTEPCDLANVERVNEIFVGTLVDDDHFVGTSTVTGTDADQGLFTQTCWWSYTRTSDDAGFSDVVKESNCCGLIPAEECSGCDCDAMCNCIPSCESSSSSTSCSSSSSSSTSCSSSSSSSFHCNSCSDDCCDDCCDDEVKTAVQTRLTYVKPVVRQPAVVQPVVKQPVAQPKPVVVTRPVAQPKQIVAVQPAVQVKQSVVAQPAVKAETVAKTKDVVLKKKYASKKKQNVGKKTAAKKGRK